MVHRYRAHLAAVMFVTAMVFVSFGMTIPLLSEHVETRLGGGEFAVGAAWTTYTWASVVAGVAGGSALRHWDPWPVLIGGALVSGGAVAASGASDTLEALLVLRVVSGVATGAAYAAAGTLAVRLAPVDRRGETLGYFTAALWIGLAVGPALAELVSHHAGPGIGWAVAGAAPVLGAIACWPLQRDASAVEPAAAPTPSRSARSVSADAIALWPGAVLMLSVVGYASFQTFIPLYADEVGLRGVGGIFALYSGVVLGVRVLGARKLDDVDSARAGFAACLLNAAALLCLATWAAPAGVYVATVGLALSIAIQYPSLLKLALEAVRPRGEGLVVGSFNAAFNVGVGLGSVLIGGVASTASYRAGFAAAATCAIGGAGVHSWRFGTGTRSLPQTTIGKERVGQ